MRVPHGEGLANRPGFELCAAAREGGGEALTGGRAGQVLSREKRLRGADAVLTSGRPHSARRYCKTRRDPARSKTLCMRGSTSHGNREIPRLPAVMGIAGRIGKSKDASR
jgi:hypothetical protein